MKYRGYTAKVEFDDEDNIFVGRVLGIRAIIGFHGETVAELRGNFESLIDFHVDMRERKGEEPEKPYSGKFNVRVSPELHASIAVLADKTGKSMNQWINDKLQQGI